MINSAANRANIKKHIILFLLFAIPSFLPAQSPAEEIEALLETNAVTFAQAARFVLEASDVMATADSREAFLYAAERGWLPKKATPDSLIRMDAVSLLLMKSFDIKGGILFLITKSPHYAYRELTHRDVIQGRADPAMNVSGERLLFFTNRILSLSEN